MEKILAWIDARFPLTKVWDEHAAKYYAPKNFNTWYIFGSLAMLVLVIQIVTGLFLAMHYKPDTALAFASVEYIMRDVPWGWLIRYLHSTGASAFFIVVYLHMFRAMLYGSYREPRELIWFIGVVIFIALMATAFLGYLLPWGNMSYWGAQVIISLFDAIPFVGPPLAEWIRGDFVVSDATLNRFFALHFFIPVIILPALVFVHIVALHKVGSNNPDGVEIKKKKNSEGVPVDGVPFHPFYTVHDIFGVAVFLIAFCAVVFFLPDMGGWFLEHDNFVPANILQTPSEIVPLWYFTPFYSILRAITTDMVNFGLVPFVLILAGLSYYSLRSNVQRAVVIGSAVVILIGFFVMQAKVWGVIMMGLSLMLFFALPYLDRSKVKSIRYRGWMYKTALSVFAVSFVILGYLGTKSPETIDLFLVKNVYWVQVFTIVYFAFFLFMPWYTTLDKTKPVPERVK